MVGTWKSTWTYLNYPTIHFGLHIDARSMSCSLCLRSRVTDEAARAFARHIGCGQDFGRDGSFEGPGGSGHHHGKAWKSSEDMDNMDMDDIGAWSRHWLWKRTQFEVSRCTRGTGMALGNALDRLDRSQVIWGGPSMFSSPAWVSRDPCNCNWLKDWWTCGNMISNLKARTNICRFCPGYPWMNCLCNFPLSLSCIRCSWSLETAVILWNIRPCNCRNLGLFPCWKLLVMWVLAYPPTPPSTVSRVIPLWCCEICQTTTPATWSVTQCPVTGIELGLPRQHASGS